MKFKMAAWCGRKRLIDVRSIPAIQSEIRPLTNALNMYHVPFTIGHIDMRQYDVIVDCIAAETVSETNSAICNLFIHNTAMQRQ